MRLTTMTDYAVRLLIYLGQHPDRLCTISEITECYGISQSHLMKVTSRLGRAGWITTIRGKHGGIRLGHPPQDIPLGNVIRDMENDLNLVECLGDTQTCILIGHCTLPRILTEALQKFMDHLNQYSLADLLENTATPFKVTIPAPPAHSES